MRRRTAWVIVFLCIGLFTLRASAKITALIPLKAVLAEATHILAVKVQALDPQRPAMVLTAEQVLKGKPPFARLPVSLKGDAEAAKEKQTPDLLRRLAPGLQLVLFINQRDSDYTAFAYTNGTWFQMTGTTDGAAVRWSFTHLEPFLRRTYKGPTAELTQLILDGLAGKKKLPEVNPKEKPGLGPEVESPKKKSHRNEFDIGARTRVVSTSTGNQPFAVIPTVFVGGPLALLAALFPALFGGMLFGFKRWLAALTVVSLNSTLLFAQEWFRGPLEGSWWGTPQALWLTMSAITLVGLLWAWRRHLGNLAAGMVTAEPPKTSGIVTLFLISVITTVAAWYWLPHDLKQLDLWGKTVITLGVGVWLATLHALWLRLSAASSARPALPGEGVLLWGSLVACTGLALTFATSVPAGGNVQAVRQGEGDRSAKFVGVAWRFRPKEPCWIASSARVDGDHVLVGAVHGSAFRSGAVYCLDRTTGEQRWAFTNNGKMKDAFSSPTVADGKVYIGEGFHQDSQCRLYCLNAQDGKKLWEFPTGSHTESTPCVADGKVYFGAGDDGLYCLDAATGKELWHLNELHVDANPIVANGRLYCGSGVGDVYKATAVFCLDAAEGKVLWRIPTELPVWGEPALLDGKLFVGVGNGNFQESADRPVGALLCLDAATGRRLWQCDARDGVHVKITAEKNAVYFASRDQHVYAVAPADGKVLWKADLGSPILASPALTSGGSHVIAVASEGKVACLDAKTGKEDWSFDVHKDTAQPTTLYSSPTAIVDGTGRRRIYFGSGLSGYSRGILYCLEDQVLATGAVAKRH